LNFGLGARCFGHPELLFSGVAQFVLSARFGFGSSLADRCLVALKQGIALRIDFFGALPGAFDAKRSIVESPEYGFEDQRVRNDHQAYKQNHEADQHGERGNQNQIGGCLCGCSRREQKCQGERPAPCQDAA